MTTRAYLGQIDMLRCKIENKMEERYRLQQLAYRITVPIEGERVKSTSNPDRMTDAVAKIIACETDLNSVIEQFIDKRNEIIALIDTMESQNSYSVLTYRYVQGLSDKEIAIKLGINSLSGVKKIHKNALIEFEEKFGTKYLTTEDIYEKDRKKTYDVWRE